MKKFILEIPIEAEECTNPNFPIDTNARMILGELLQNTQLFCLKMQMSLITQNKIKNDISELPIHLQELYNSYDRKIKYVEELMHKIKLNRIEDI